MTIRLSSIFSLIFLLLVSSHGFTSEPLVPERAAILPPLYAEKFEHLDESKQSNLASYLGKNMIISLFGPDCSWCRKQHRVLKSIGTDCSNTAIIMMGVGASKRKLQIELRRDKNKFPAFKINNNLLNAIGDPTVPRLMIFNHHGEAKINLLGFKPKDELLLLMREHLDTEC